VPKPTRQGPQGFWDVMAYTERTTAEKSFQIGQRNLGPPALDIGEDHTAHVAGRTCACCREPIMRFQAARIVGGDEWVHDGCHRPAIGSDGFAIGSPDIPAPGRDRRFRRRGRG
jgi:hypothetical protein